MGFFGTSLGFHLVYLLGFFLNFISDFLKYLFKGFYFI